jgi:peptide/nickel transport system substrate-binding protein
MQAHKFMIRTLLALFLITVSVVMSVSAQEEPVTGGTLRLSSPAITSLNPLVIADDASFYVASQIFSSLVRSSVNDEGIVEPIGDLAESWDYEEDGKVIIFHLRHDVTFQDGNAVFAEGEGREVVADDVVYSLDRTLNTEGSTAALPDLVASYESVEAVDDYTVKLTLKQPNALLFSGGRGLSATVIYPHEAIEQLGEDGFNDAPIGSGPFEFVEYVPDDHVTLQRNEDYFIPVNLDGVVFQIIPEGSVALIALEAGEIDITDAPQQELARLREDSNFTLTPALGGTCPVAVQFIFPMNVAP